MIRFLFFAFVTLALLGDARIFLFLLNRSVFGDHREEKPPWTSLVFAVPPLLLALTLLFWPLSNWIDRLVSPPERLESLGMAWLIVAASVGMLWIVERIHITSMREHPLSGVESARTSKSRAIPWRNQVYDLEVTRHTVFIDDLPAAFDGYRVAFITDTHVAPFIRRAHFENVVAQARAFDPDIVIFGGDFVSWRRHIPLAGEVLTTGLSARDGLFAVLGNHDYWASADEVKREFEARGVTFIINRAVPLQRGGEQLWLIGIDEMYRGEPRMPEVSGPCIGVSHHPDIIEIAADRRIDLLVCGHTHGGQVRVPFFGALVVPSRHEGEFAAGFHRVRNVLMYVSRGIGAIPPIRLLCRPELATFTLRRGRRHEPLSHLD